MNISDLDWAIVAVYFVAALAIGLYFSRRAGKDIGEFFGAGGSLPWWLAGTSMVATTFAADTPLAVTEMVYDKGVAGNWLWWAALISGMLTVFFYARLWKRVGVLTDVEFAEIRYGGRPASFLRGFRALYLGVLMNAVIMGWVITAMGTIVSVALGIDKWVAIAACLAITVVYSGLSGLWGVIVTDFFQFAMAMAGSIMLAVFGLSSVGGVGGLKTRLVENLGSPERAEQFLSVAPPIGTAWMPLILFLTYVGVQWWASWYPGAEPGGGGYIAQRMFSAKDEKHSLLATLWFNIAHYAVRPWPWILTALVAFAIFPKIDVGAEKIKIADPSAEVMTLGDRGGGWRYVETEAGYELYQAGAPDKRTLIDKPGQLYVAMMVSMLPKGLLGLMFAAMAAAFMSTISTQLNWGSSYVINDFYIRFIKPEADPGHYVMASRIVTLVLVIVGGLVGYLMESVKGGWELLLTIGAGTGMVFILRWFWWRVNAWSEISAMIAALAVSLGLKGLQKVGALEFPPGSGFAYEMIITAAVTTWVWVRVTLNTSPETDAVLDGFYRRARPGGPGWKPVRQRIGHEVEPDRDLAKSFLCWIEGCVLVYAFLFGTGKLILGDTLYGLAIVSVGVAAGALIYWDLSSRGFETLADGETAGGENPGREDIIGE